MAIMKKLRVSVQLLVICPFAATYFNNSFNYSRSSFSLGLTSLLNELSFPPFSMMFISSLTSLENYNNLLLYLSLMLNFPYQTSYIIEVIMEFNDDNHGNLLHQGQLAKQFW